METQIAYNGIVFAIVMSLLISASVGQSNSSKALPAKPNILLIMVDDLGIGDIGCFGNDTIRTPNFDRLAKEGAKLTHHLSAASMCTPSRAAFLTGRYAIRFGMVPHDMFRVNFFLSSTSGLPPDEVTFGEIAQEKGYSTAFIGKWHLGLHCHKNGDFCHHPLNQGFDYYYGLPLTNLKDYGEDGLTMLQGRRPHIFHFLYGLLIGVTLFGYSLKKFGILGKKGFIFMFILSVFPLLVIQYMQYTMKYLNPLVMRNFEIVEQPLKYEGITDRLVEEGVDYLEARHSDKQPFLLVMSWIQVHTALHASKPFKDKSVHGPYGDEVEEMDWSIGEILNTLDRLGFDKNTFVFVTSDHGGHNEEFGVHGNREGGWNGIFRGGKGQGGMEGGIRVPTVARWPGIIPPSSVIDTPTSTLDVLPTVAGILGADLPNYKAIDGKDILPLLRSKNKEKSPHKFLIHYCGDQIHAARYIAGNGQDVYKIHLGTPNWLPGTQGCRFLCMCNGNDVTWHDPPIMFNIAQDPSEKSPLDVSRNEYKTILNKILKYIEEHKKSLKSVETQFRHGKLAPRFWLQPCCNFPYCKCEETRIPKTRR